jgi:Fuc2NAc and GlcNAc transferase
MATTVVRGPRVGAGRARVFGSGSPVSGFLIYLITFAIAFVGTGVVRWYAQARRVLDIPNERSSHVAPKPRGGGLAIVIAVLAGVLAVAVREHRQGSLLIALVGGGVVVAAVGFLDDHHGLRPEVRLAAHLGAAFWALAWLGNLPPLQVGGHLISLGWGGYLLGAAAIVWTLNLFNFMDGIDGLAASEAIVIACGGAALVLIKGDLGAGSGTLQALMSGRAGAVPVTGFILAAACLGFLLWNWPPAKIFMGDVGSGYLGYVIAVLALAAAKHNPVALWEWWILGGVFFVDATVTLLRRLLRGERVYEAHRSHAYQWLARRWGGHLPATLSVVAVNLLWLCPWAWVASVFPRRAAWICATALLPLTVVVLAVGAGKREGRSSTPVSGRAI